MGIAKHTRSDGKWMYLECWKRIVAKPGETPPVPTLRMICDECGVQKVLVTNVRTDSHWPRHQRSARCAHRVLVRG
jgi:hypothetical protein